MVIFKSFSLLGPGESVRADQRRAFKALLYNRDGFDPQYPLKNVLITLQIVFAAFCPIKNLKNNYRKSRLR